MSEDTVIELDWYKDYNIKIIPSVKSSEAYSTVGDFKIDENWGRAFNLKDGYKAIYHETFAFSLQDMYRVIPLEKKIIKQCVENVEKIYLLQHLGVHDIPSVGAFIKPEGAKYPVVSHELIEDIAYMELDSLFNNKTDNKDIYYFQRVKWTINDKQIRGRFSFLVLNK